MRSSTLFLRQIEDQFIIQLTNCNCVKELKKIHAQILVSFLSQSSFLATRIINICNSSGSIDYASHVFNQVLDSNIFLYNAMIKAYAQNHHFLRAIVLYKQVLRCSLVGDRFTYPFVLKSCGGLLHCQLGQQVHLRVIKSGLDSNLVVQNSLLEMYAKVDDLLDARKVFDDLSARDAVSWNTLISGHVRVGQMRTARAIFDAMPNKTVVSCTAMISGYSMAGRYSNAVEVFRRMQVDGLEPDEVSIVSVIPACAQLGSLELGKWIHAYAHKHGLMKPFICNALIEMYCRCGSLEQALQLFEKMSHRDVISWSTMIWGFALHGRAREAERLFKEMVEGSDVRPNAVTFLGLFAAFSHGGLLHEGLHYFNIMKKVYRIEPRVDHYGCIIDLLCRSGWISHAVEVIGDMPVPADATVWSSLLSACRTHGDIAMAVRAMEQLVKLEPDDLGNYVLLSNIYASEKRWDDVSRIRRIMKNRSLKKAPGGSSIELDSKVHEFMAGSDPHLQSVDMADMLQLLAIATGKTRAFAMSEDDERIFSFDTHALETYEWNGK